MTEDKRFSGVLGGGEYDLLKKALWYYDDLEESVANEISKNIENKKDVKILEIGIGSGITTAFVLNKISDISSVTIYAIDNEEKMLEEARHRFSEVKNIEFVNSDIIQYLKSIEDNYFDACYSGYVIHNFNPKLRKELFVELGRVIKKGGVFVNGDKIVVDDIDIQKDFYQKETATFLEFDKIGRPEIREEWTKHYEEDELIRFEESEQKRLLQESGFENVNFIFRELMGAVVTATKK